MIISVVLAGMAGCRNNLVNNWENYTGDTDVYYDPQDGTSGSSDVPTDETDTGSVGNPSQESDLSEYSIPDHWEDELKTAVEETQSVISKTDDCTAFFWYTDTHWSYGSQRSLSIIKYLEDHTSVKYTNFGGDVVNTYNIEENENIKQLDEWREASLNLNNHHSVVGNHDDDIPKLESREALYSFLIAPELNAQPGDDGHFCYCVDDASQNTRYIYLSTGFEKTTTDDLAFLVQALSDTPADWHIVLVSHIWFMYYDTSEPAVGEIPDYAIGILDIIDAYNNRSSGVINNIEFDFLTAKAKVEFCIGGHTHVDFDFRTDGGVPVILTETDSYHLRDDGKDTSGTDESSVNVVIADYENNTIHIIRAGRGDSKTVTIDD
jgi:predicted phosphodiesterase